MESKVSRNVDVHTGTCHSNISDFTEYLSLQAARMEINGFTGEAGGLRRWVTELKYSAVSDAIRRKVELRE
jgi:hypothetical protein